MATQKRFISNEEALSILEKGSYGVLSTVSGDGWPYGIPVNYCYLRDENCIFFHSALSGKKLDHIAGSSKVSFLVVGFDQVIPEKFTTHYESVIADGYAKAVSDEAEKKQKLAILCKKFAPGVRSDEMIAKYTSHTTVVKIIIESVSGKRNRD